MLYNIAGRTGTNIETPTLRRLAEIPNIIGVKEASGNISQIAEVCATLPDDFLVFSGDDAITLAVIGLGGVGIVSVASNEIPAEMTRMTQAALANKWDVGATDLPQVSSADAGELHRVESRPGEGSAVDDGKDRRGLSAADGADDDRKTGRSWRRSSPKSGCCSRIRSQSSKPVVSRIGRRWVLAGSNAGAATGERYILPATCTSCKLHIERLYADGAASGNDRDARASFERFRDALTAGKIRAAEKWREPGKPMPGSRRASCWDFASAHSRKAATPAFSHSSTKTLTRSAHFTADDRVRVVPGGSSVRSGAYVAPSVVCMPPDVHQRWGLRR